jgi:hypothetical protein
VGNPDGNDTLQDLGVNGSIIIKYILGNKMGGRGLAQDMDK